MISVDEACRLIESLPLRPRRERVALEDACDRILASPVVATNWAPRCDVSAMDGYAVREADLAIAPTRLRVVGQSFAGDAMPSALAPGACMRIFTGAPAPPGADRVVVQEAARREGDVLLLDERPQGARHIRRAGSDFSPGEILIEAGARLTPQALVAAAAADRAEVEVFARPRVAILSTGDELVAPGACASSPGAIPDSVSFGVAGLVRAWGGKVVARRRLPDRIELLRRAAAEAAAVSDIVVVTGGASVGERDYGKAMFEEHDLELLFAKVAIKPGKPVWLGRAGGILVLGLPGNPSAAMTTARLFLAPLLAAAGGGAAADAWRWRAAPLAEPLAAGGERECFQRGALGADGVRPLANQDSSSQKSLAAADLLIRRRPGARALSAGEPVEVLSF